MWRRLKNTSATPARLEKFRKFRQHVKNWIRFERKKYLTEIANEVSTNAKRFWSYFSLKMGESQFQIRLFIKVLPYLKIGQELKLLITISSQSLKIIQTVKKMRSL